MDVRCFFACNSNFKQFAEANCESATTYYWIWALPSSQWRGAGESFIDARFSVNLTNATERTAQVYKFLYVNTISLLCAWLHVLCMVIDDIMRADVCHTCPMLPLDNLLYHPLKAYRCRITWQLTPTSVIGRMCMCRSMQTFLATQSNICCRQSMRYHADLSGNKGCGSGRFSCRFHRFRFRFRFHFAVQILVAIPPTKMEAVNRFHIPSCNTRFWSIWCLLTFATFPRKNHFNDPKTDISQQFQNLNQSENGGTQPKTQQTANIAHKYWKRHHRNVSNGFLFHTFWTDHDFDFVFTFTEIWKQKSVFVNL